MPRTWKQIVWEYVCKCADAEGYFTLDQLRDFFPKMIEEKPNNPYVAEKVRQQLQILRDEGRVSFLIPGSYRVSDQTRK